MRFFHRIYILLVFLISACTSNSIDNPDVDCSISTLDFSFEVTASDCGDNNGSIMITASGGNPPYVYEILNPLTRILNPVTDLAAGNYSIIITDNAQCSITKEVLVPSKGGFQATALLEPSGCKSANGTITAQPQSGVLPYMYSLGLITQSSPLFTDLSAGQYEVIITDATGCDFSLIETVLSGVSYASTIEPLISSSCAVTNCHNGSQFPDLRTYDGVKANTKNIREFTQSGFMPRNGSLTQTEKDVIACWIDDGAFDN